MKIFQKYLIFNFIPIGIIKRAEYLRGSLDSNEVSL